MNLFRTGRNLQLPAIAGPEVAQLASLSILDALALSQKGYPQRDTYTDFLERVRLLVFVTWLSNCTPPVCCIEAGVVS